MSASLTSHSSIGKGEERSAFSRGRTARNWVVFINSRRGCGAEGETLGIRTLLTCLMFECSLPLLQRRSNDALQVPPVDENHPISGSSPRYLCASGNWGSARQITRPLSHSSGASAAATGDEPPSRLSLRVRESLGWRLSRSLLRHLPWRLSAGASFPSLLVALHNPGRKALGLCA